MIFFLNKALIFIFVIYTESKINIKINNKIHKTLLLN